MPPAPASTWDAGDGKLMPILLDEPRAARRLVGVDIAAADSGVYQRVHTVAGDRIPEPTRLDFVFSNSVLEHIDDLEPVIAETARAAAQRWLLSPFPPPAFMNASPGHSSVGTASVICVASTGAARIAAIGTKGSGALASSVMACGSLRQPRTSARVKSNAGKICRALLPASCTRLHASGCSRLTSSEPCTCATGACACRTGSPRPLPPRSTPACAVIRAAASAAF